MQCPRCQHDNRPQAKFCEECGRPLRRTNASGSPGASHADLEREGDETRKQEGTSLGLTLAKKFVGLHGGRIWVKSKVGSGSAFTFTLPVN